MTPTIYVVGNMQPYFAVFTGLQMIFNPANNTPLASGSGIFSGGPLIVIGVVGMLLMLYVVSILKQRFHMHHAMLMVFAYAMAFGITTNVNIQNIFNGQAEVVDSIPIGIAYPAAIASDFAHDMGNAMASAFQVTNTNNTYAYADLYSNNSVFGFDGPLALMYKLRGLYALFSLQNQALDYSFNQYVASCVTPQGDAIASGAISTSPDLACTLFGAGSNCTGAQEITPAQAQAAIDVNSSDQKLSQIQLVSCSTAQSTLANAWNSYLSSTGTTAPNLQSLLDQKTTGSGLDNISIDNASQIVGSMMNASSNAGLSFMENMVLNCAFQAGYYNGINVYNIDGQAPLSSYCVTKTTAFGRQAISNAAQASFFGVNMVPLMSVMQFIFYAAFPFAVGVLFLRGPSGMRGFGMYLMFGFATMLWIPISQIITDYAIYVMTHVDSQIQQQLTVPITSPAAIPTILTHAMRNMSMADKMLGITPVISVLVLGSGGAYALTMGAQDQQVTQGISTNIGEATPTAGNSALSNGATGFRQVSPGSAAAALTPAALEAASFNAGAGAQQAALAANTSALSYQQAATTAQIQTATDMAQVLDSANSSTSSYLQNDTSAIHSFSKLQSEANQVSLATGFNKSQAMAFSAALSAELGGNLLGKNITARDVSAAAKKAGIDLGTFGAQGSAGEAAKIADQINNTATKSAINSLTSSQAAQLVSKVASGEQSSQMRTLGANIAKSAATAKSNSMKAESARQQAAQYNRQASEFASEGGADNFDLTRAMSALDGEYGGNPARAEQYARAYAARNGVEPAFEKYLQRAYNAGATGMAPVAYAVLQTAATSSAGKGFRFASQALGGFMPVGTGAKVAQGQQQLAENAAVTDAADNQKALAQANALIGQIRAAFGGKGPSAAGAAAEFGQFNAAAHDRYNSDTGTGDYNPGAAEAAYKKFEAAAEKLVKMPGWNKLANHVKDKNDNKLMSLAHLIEKHPGAAEDIGAVIAAGGVLGGVAGAVRFGRFLKGKLPNGGSGGTPTSEGSGGTPTTGGAPSTATEPTPNTPWNPADGETPLEQSESTAAGDLTLAGTGGEGSAAVAEVADVLLDIAEIAPK